MPRGFNTNTRGGVFTEAEKRDVWNKAMPVLGVDPQFRRKDKCGAWIEWGKYGQTVQEGNGWEIDHIRPVAKGGGDELANLQPLQWQNNREKGDNYPILEGAYCRISTRM